MPPRLHDAERVPRRERAKAATAVIWVPNTTVGWRPVSRKREAPAIRIRPLRRDNEKAARLGRLSHENPVFGPTCFELGRQDSNLRYPD